MSQRRKGGSKFMKQSSVDLPTISPTSPGKSWHSETKDSFTQAMDSTSTVAWPKMHTVNGYVNRSLPGMYGTTQQSSGFWEFKP